MVEMDRRRNPEKRLRPGKHIAHLYGQVEHMVNVACRYIADGLRRGEAVLVVATRVNWAQMIGRLAAKRGIDIVDAVMEGRLRHVDAEVVLGRLLVNGMLDDNRFVEYAGRLLEGTSGRFGRVRVFTELAGILWAAGNRPAAIRLEELWEGLTARLPVALLCTYRTDTVFPDGYNPALNCVCSAHSFLLQPYCKRQDNREANALTPRALRNSRWP